MIAEMPLVTRCASGVVNDSRGQLCSYILMYLPPKSMLGGGDGREGERRWPP